MYSISSLEYSVPESRTEEVSDENSKYYYPEEGMSMVSFEEDSDNISDDKVRGEFIEGFTSSLDSNGLISESEITIDNNLAYRYEMTNVL